MDTAQAPLNTDARALPAEEDDLLYHIQDQDPARVPAPAHPAVVVTQETMALVVGPLCPRLNAQLCE